MDRIIIMNERKQNIKHSTRQKLAINYTLSGQLIKNGIDIMGNPVFCGCGFETAPGFNCPKCQGF